ncbi:MAG: SDR family NAD(P)-dependent oxidoreductase [Oligoflexales bacterium]|nr:SDR family NAD(P)-dependent oxidoreductase [Oligoflexales bacterium]
MSKKALVTGASEGIGRVFAKKLAAEGFLVTAVARNEALLKSLMTEIKGGHDYLVADLSREDGQKLVAKRLEQGYQLLVNNAGVGVVGEFTSSSLTNQINMMHLNCDALVYLSHEFLKHSKGGDALLNVSSCLAFTASPGMSVYAATKAFVSSFSDALWFEQKKRGVYVMGLCPGITSTRFQVSAGGSLDDLPKNLAQTPEEVVAVALEHLKWRCKSTVISGVKNKIFSFIMSRLFSRKVSASMMGNMMKMRK